MAWISFLGSPLTKKQHVVSRSFVEIEYQSKFVLTSEIKWLGNIISNLGASLASPMCMYIASQSALYIAHN